MFFVGRSRCQELRVQAQLLDVAENEKGVFDLPILHDLLQVLVLDQELVDEFLGGGEGQPNHQVSF